MIAATLITAAVVAVVSHVSGATIYSGRCDQNADGYVNAADLGHVVRAAVDINRDGVSDSTDLGLCAAAFGPYTRAADCDCADPEGDVATEDAMTPQPCSTGGETLEEVSATFAAATATAQPWPTCDAPTTPTP